jgi:catechol 2,3-dioxygenase-like lactoylglutathione lyase family enzyme
MDITYRTALIFVRDVARSRQFYCNCLGQQVEYDFGQDIVFKGGFAIHDIQHISRLLHDRPAPDGPPGKDNLELYFESDDLDSVFKRLSDYGVTFIHGIKQQPWGQRVLRCYDPDRHMVEIGEPISTFVRRFLEEGLSAEEAAARTSVPLADVQKIQAEIQP